MNPRQIRNQTRFYALKCTLTIEFSLLSKRKSSLSVCCTAVDEVANVDDDDQDYDDNDSETQQRTTTKGDNCNFIAPFICQSRWLLAAWLTRWLIGWL
ncbi:unnamed protein product [Ceratitis capitata]|uniref:(Mediterranean fruit fly) hypothetical protein n=1 Tax=Ceratitis capitata TaxID=7213 RepID=A0A811UKM6_CERCA|nr:unnamed protein product [Ceratitis capitata]